MRLKSAISDLSFDKLTLATMISIAIQWCPLCNARHKLQLSKNNYDLEIDWLLEMKLQKLFAG